MENYYFFLGGMDAEMVAIRQALDEIEAPYLDAGLSWGTKASHYGDEIAKVACWEMTPILVELEVDIDLPKGAVIVDHHGSRAGEPASILQVLNLLGVEPTRYEFLIAANDSGYIPAMVAAGATQEEVTAIRLADRSAQGITPEQEDDAEEAIYASDAEAIATLGGLAVIHLAHSKCATVTDRLFQYWKDEMEKLLVLSSDGEANFFGDGALCAELKEKFGGWNGGSGLGKAGESAFWGGYPNHLEVEAFIRSYLK